MKKYVNYPRDPILLSLARAAEIQPWIVYRHALELAEYMKKEKPC